MRLSLEEIDVLVKILNLCVLQPTESSILETLNLRLKALLDAETKYRKLDFPVIIK